MKVIFHYTISSVMKSVIVFIIFLSFCFFQIANASYLEVPKSLECQVVQFELNGLKQNKIGTQDSFWSLVLSPTGGKHSLYKDKSDHLIDINDDDGKITGCEDTDNDTSVGQMTVLPIARQDIIKTQCDKDYISTDYHSYSLGRGGNSVGIISGSKTKNDCELFVNQLNISQKISPGQAEGKYSIDLTLTLIAY